MAHTFDADDLGGDLTKGLTPLTAAFPMHWSPPSDDPKRVEPTPMNAVPMRAVPKTGKPETAKVPGRNIA